MGKHKGNRFVPAENVRSRSHSILDNAEKDDEERRLESMLFGVPFVPSKRTTEDLSLKSDHGESFAENEFSHLDDEDIFFIDDGAPTAHLDVSDNSHDEDDSLPHEDTNINDENFACEAVPIPKSTSGKTPAWTDSDDTTLQLSLTSDKRLQKLRSAPSDDVVGGREYELRLRRQFERINPAPSWVSAARKKLHPARKRRRLSDSSVSYADDEEDVVLDLLSSTNGIVHRPENPTILQQGSLSIERLRDANQSAKTDGRVQAVQFHPSPQVPVLLTAGSDRRLRLFNIDGLTNPHLQTLHVPTLPITNALFHPSGSSILATGPRPHYFSYDLQSGVAHLSPRGLWGTTFNRTNPASQEMSMEKCAFNHNGEVLAVAGRHGYVHLVDWKSGTGQVVGSLKMNADVKSLWWPPEISGRSRHLMSLGADSEVYVWDIGERMCVRRWRDDGGFGSVLMSGDPAGGYLAIGSNTGLVNLYKSDMTVWADNDNPTLLKCLGNLTTSISSIRFNHDSQVLAIASTSKKDQLRLIHLPSATAFSNWPTSSTPLSHVTCVDFSAHSEYVVVGNNQGRVLLYNLRDFAKGM